MYLYNVQLYVSNECECSEHAVHCSVVVYPAAASNINVAPLHTNIYSILMQITHKHQTKLNENTTKNDIVQTSVVE